MTSSWQPNGAPSTIGRRQVRRLAFTLVELLVVISWSGCGKPAAAVDQQANYGSIRDQVVQQVKTGHIKPNESGVALLPPDFQSASINGQIVAGQNPTAGWVVAFPLQEGRAVAQCLLYVEKAAPAAGQSLQLGALTITIGSKSADHWFQGAFAGR